jgi:hypothetical protein
MKRITFLLAALAVMLLAVAPALAQTATGGLRGTVVDQDERTLPGVSITITSPALQGERVATTDAEGKFRFALLPPGTYAARFVLASFQAVERTGIRIVLEQTITLEVTMNVAFREEVIVSGDAPLVDTTTTTMGTTFLATGAVDGGGMASDQVAGNASIMGATAAENRYVVDSLDTTNVAYGTSGTSVSMNFIQEMQVKTGGYEAEFGGALGGVINMITKSGGNDFNGELFGSFTNKSLWDDPKLPESGGEAKSIDRQYDVGFGLGGKLIQDKLWYYLGYNPNTTDQQVQLAIYRINGDYLSTNEFIRTTDRQYLTGKLTWQLTPSHTVTINAVGDPTSLDNQYYSSFYVDSQYAPETDQFYSSEDRGGINYGVNWNGLLSTSVMIEAKFGHHEYQEENVPRLIAPNYADQTADGRWTDGVGDIANFGGPGFQNIKDQRSRDQFRAALTWYLGDNHEIKVGGQAFKSVYDMHYNMVGASDGWCAPLSDPSYGVDINAAGIGYYTAPPNCDSDGDGTLDGYLLNARLGNRWRLRNTYYYNRNYKNESKGESTEYAVFLQDGWKLSDYFTIDIGVRAESAEATGNSSSANPNAKFKFGFADQIAPRVGFVWDFAKNGRSRIFGHWGRFYESIPLDVNVRAFGNEHYDFYFYDYPASGLPSVVNGKITNTGGMWYILKTGPARVDPNVKAPYLEEVVLGGEYEVARDMAVGIKGIYRSIGEVMEDISVDGGGNYFITNPGGEVCNNPGLPDNPPLDECVTFPYASRYYRGVELSLHKRIANRWQLSSSLLWSKLEGNYEGLYSRDNQQLDPNITSKFDIPEILIGARGPLPSDREWQFKAWGSYQFDFGLLTGFTAQYLTGTPISKLGYHSSYGPDERFVEPRGTAGRSDPLYTLDLRLAYPIKLGDTMALEFSVDVFNVFNQQNAVEVDQTWTAYDETDPDPNLRTNPSWGQPLVYYPPRNIRAGVRFSF